MTEPLRAWLMLTQGRGQFRYIAAEGPCWKGELDIPLGRWLLIVGWQRRGHD